MRSVKAWPVLVGRTFQTGVKRGHGLEVRMCRTGLQRAGSQAENAVEKGRKDQLFQRASESDERFRTFHEGLGATLRNFKQGAEDMRVES